MRLCNGVHKKSKRFVTAVQYGEYGGLPILVKPVTKFNLKMQAFVDVWT